MLQKQCRKMASSTLSISLWLSCRSITLERDGATQKRGMKSVRTLNLLNDGSPRYDLMAVSQSPCFGKDHVSETERRCSY